MATMSLKVSGRAHWPSELSPQDSTIPSARKDKLCHAPAAMATRFESAAGKSVCPQELSPQAPRIMMDNEASALTAVPTALLIVTAYRPLFMLRAAATV